MNMHERIMSGKLFTDMCEGLPEERNEAKKRMIAFNLTTPDTLEERFRIQKEMLHESSGEAWIDLLLHFQRNRYGPHPQASGEDRGGSGQPQISENGLGEGIPV